MSIEEFIEELSKRQMVFQLIKAPTKKNELKKHYYKTVIVDIVTKEYK